MCIRSAFIGDIVTSFVDVDPEYYNDDFSTDVSAALLTLPTHSIGNPLAVAGRLVKTDFFIKDDFGMVVKTIGRACRSYVRFMKAQGDLWNGMPAAPTRSPRSFKAFASSQKRLQRQFVRETQAAAREKREKEAQAKKLKRGKSPRNLSLPRKYRRPAAEAMRKAALAEFAAAIAAAPPAEPAERDETRSSLEDMIASSYRWPPTPAPRILPPGVIDFTLYRSRRV